MTEQTPQDEAREKEKQRPEPRDAAFWAQRIERLEVSDVPERAANVRTCEGVARLARCRDLASSGKRPTGCVWPGSRRRRKRSCGSGRSTSPSSSRQTVGFTLR